MALGAILAAPLLMIGPIALARENQQFALGCIISGIVLTVMACLLIRQAAVARGTYGPWRQSRVIGLIVIPALVSCVLFITGMWGVAAYWINPSLRSAAEGSKFVTHYFYLISFAVLFTGLASAHFTPDWNQKYGTKSRRGVPRFVLDATLIVICSGFGVLFCAIPKYFVEYCRQNTFEGDWRVLVFGPTLMLLAFALTVIFYVGLLGTELLDGRREWWGRLGAWLILVSGGWVLIAGISIYGPEALFALHSSVKITLGTVWAAITVIGTKVASSEKTSGDADTSSARIREALAVVTPYVFIGGLLCIVSVGVQFLAQFVDDSWPVNLQAPAQPLRGLSVLAAMLGLVEFSLQYEERVFRWLRNILGLLCFGAAAIIWLPWFAGFVLAMAHRPRPYGHIFGHYWATMNMHPGVPLVVFIALAAAGTLLSMRVDVNEFSMHYFYRNRLVRAYLGASRERKIRRPNPFTGFEERDDISLCLLRAENGYYGPVPVINTALNITRGEDLATQERKAESFTFTPLRSGFDFFKPHLNPSRRSLGQYGYQRTDWSGFGRFRGVRLGTAMAISGAAVNPNAGFHSRPAVAFLLSLFNVRLGWWMRNPAVTGGSQDASPPFGLLYLLRELAGYTDVKSPYLNLSDGGHFENMGLYEMVRRRCRFIIVSDAEQDAAFSFEGLGGAVRKCRTDFGAEIDIDPRNLQPVDGTSKAHCAIGTIRYLESGATGYILYIKASLSGDEPADVLEYRKRFKDFPHQSTMDQFFTESQFESYRCLGNHVMHTVLERAAPLPTGAPWRKQLFERLQLAWSESGADARYFDEALWSAQEPEQRIALIYRAYKELGLVSQSRREPHTALLHLFRKWQQMPEQMAVWGQLGMTFSDKLFQDFYNGL